MYPIVLKELDLTKLALYQCQKINSIQELELENKDKIISFSNQENNNLKKQNDLLKKQLKKQKIKPILAAVAAVGVIILIK